MRETEEATETRGSPHGWWPYLLPYASFLLVADVLGRSLPDDWDPLLLVLKAGVPGALLLYFARCGAYPELRGVRFRVGPVVSDVVVGSALAALWIVPYVCLEPIRPEASNGFDPAQMGAGFVWPILALRMLGYALVTPIFEEIFLRSFVMRYSLVFQTRGDFRLVPLAQFSGVSFVSTVVVFTLAHQPWEYWVAVPWVVLTNLWFYYRKDLCAVILVHATTNASLLGFVTAASGSVSCGAGGPLSLWFLV